MIFVDSGAWFASVVPDDFNHAAASAWLAMNREPLITTDYIVDETLTLLRARGQRVASLALGRNFFAGTVATIHRLSASDLLETWRIFSAFGDKDWSFTDCSSKVVMSELGLTRAFTFDHHFRQFGAVVEP